MNTHKTAADARLMALEDLDQVDRLLVECVRSPIGRDHDTGSLKLWCQRVDDWDDFIARAAYHGVIGWVHEILLTVANDGCIPPRALDELRTARIVNTAKIACMSQELETLAASLDEAGVGHILLKGPFLSDSIYQRKDLRYYMDLDLLVRESEVAAATGVLEGLGYGLVESGGTIFDEGKTQAHFLKDGCLPIDLHWETVNLPTIEGSVSIDIDEIWATAQEATVAGVRTMSLSPEELLIFQCMHMTAHHDFNRLLWFKDVQQVLWRLDGNIDWKLFIEKVSRYRVRTYIYYSLVMTEEVCGGEHVPAWVYEALRPGYGTARLFEFFVRRSNILELQMQKRKPALEVWRVMRDDRGRRCGAILKRIFPAVDWYLECYPFLPKIRNRKLYYGVYPALMALRLIKKPSR